MRHEIFRTLVHGGSVGSWRPSCGLLELEADGTIRDRLLPVK